MKTLLSMAMRRLVLLATCLMFSIPVLAGVRLEAPEKAARGDAFLAQAISDQPVRHFVFHWMGKTFTAVAQADSQNSGQWRAVILLPVPLDEKAAGLELGVAAVPEVKKAKSAAPTARGSATSIFTITPQRTGGTWALCFMPPIAGKDMLFPR